MGEKCYVGNSGGRVGWKWTHTKRDTETLRAAALVPAPKRLLGVSPARSAANGRLPPVLPLSNLLINCEMSCARSAGNIQ